MNVCFLVQNIYSLGGLETVTISLAKQLMKQNDVSIITFYKKSEQVYDSFEELNIHSLELPNDRKKLNSDDLILLQSVLKKLNPNIIIVQLGTSFKQLTLLADIELFVLLQKISKTYVVIHESPKYTRTFYNLGYNTFYSYIHALAVTILKYRPQQKLFFSKTNRIIESFITLSKGCFNELKKYYKINSLIRYNYYNFLNHKIDINNKKNIIVWAGRISPEKNLKLLIDSWRLIKNKTNWELQIIGDGEQKEFLISYINKNNISNINFLGRLNHNKVISIFEQSKILAITSFFEGFPTIITEAMNMKCCVISVKYDGYSDELLNNETGIIVNRYNSHLFAKKLDELMHNDTKLLDFQKKGYEQCKEFSKKTVTNTYI